ncbi:MAG: chromosomal replication initiator protein DnaA [Deltaproteobacteria bacterium]|nr:chromosomal replication initiator protein DnaA [Deltaproteobacteria bacterium]MBW2082999.1 chromosomal replication initiator protein DnaA [Deltaproteobacteria bacterium]
MKEVWEEIKNQIRAELPKNSFSLWIRPLSFLERRNGTLVLGCPNRFSKNWVADNYKALIQEKLDKAGLGPMALEFKVQHHCPEHLLTPPSEVPQQLCLPNMGNRPPRGYIGLNRNFTFDRFVVGPCNEFAYSASKAMAQDFAWGYNTLLMFAGTGLGKSHLSQAMCHKILECFPDKRVYYITAEDFTNEMISCLRHNRIEEFKKKYREACDVLLLEEVHFLSGKEKTQAELGHTLDALFNDKKKIIFTSSLPPKDIPSLSQDLSSRLTGGLVTTIERPDFDTRVKIIRKKALEMKLPLPDDVAELLAEKLTRDVRQMESALNCLKAKSELLNEKISRDLAREALRYLTNTNDIADMEDILELVCKYYKIGPEIIGSKSRKKIHTHPRNIFIYLCRTFTEETLQSISRAVNRSHSTVLYAYETIEKKIRAEAKVRKEVEFLIRKIKQGGT